MNIILNKPSINEPILPKLFITFFIALLLPGFTFGQQDVSKFEKEISKYYKIENSIKFSQKILNVKIAKDTDEYVLVTEGDENNILSYYNSDNSLRWQKEIGNSIRCDISENGNTITTYPNSVLEVYDRSGQLLFSKGAFETGYYISQNGKYLIDYKGDSPRQFYYHNRNGQKITPRLPNRFDAHLFYLRFTQDNKILALFIGQQSDKPFVKELPNRLGSKKGRKKIIFKPIENIEVSSYLLKFDPKSDQIVWKKRLKEINKNSRFMNLNYFAMGKSFFILDEKLIVFFDDVFKKSQLLCFNYKTGEIIWEKEYNISLGFTSDLFATKDENSLFVLSKAGLIFNVDFIKQSLNNIVKIPKKYNASGTYLQMANIEDRFVLYDTWPQHHFSVNNTPDETIKYKKIKGAMVKGNSGKTYIYDGYSFLPVSQKKTEK